MCDKVVSEDPFLIIYCPDEYKTQGMCDKAADDSLAVLKLISDWLGLLYTQMKIYSTLTKILAILNFFVMKWVFLIEILIILTLTILIMMKMILILLLLSDFWLGILNLKNAMHLKKS